MNNTLIEIERQTLSDGSYVFNVNLDTLQLGAITEKDAEALAQGIKVLIETHTNDEPKIVRLGFK